MSVYEIIAAWCERERISIPELARAAGIADNLIYQLKRPTAKGRPRSLSPATARALAAVMKLHDSQLRPPPGTRLIGRMSEAVDVLPPSPPAVTAEASDEAVALLREIRDIQAELLDLARQSTRVDVQPATAAERRRRA